MQITRRDWLSAATAVLASSLPGRGIAGGTVRAIGEGDGVARVTLSSGHRVWTRRIGTGRTKVLLLHGGPGLSHDYLDCFADFLPAEGFETYFYDQLGCGLSDRPTDPALWTIDRYVEEVEEVREALGLNDVVLIGHSWGGQLAIEYALRHQKHMRALVISNMTASASDYTRYGSIILNRMPADVVAKVLEVEESRKFEDAQFNRILSQEYYPRYVFRGKSVPAGLSRSLKLFNFAIEDKLIGPDQFRLEGDSISWDRWADLHEISIPTLTMGATYDFMDPRSMEREAQLVRNGKYHHSATGSHMAMYDDQQNYFSGLLSFLKRHRS